MKNKSPYTSPKEVGQILNEQIDAGLKEFNRSNTGLFISAFAAGLEIGFSILLMGAVLSYFGADASHAQIHLLLSLCYPLGFIFVVIGRSELFTEHTALAILPVLNGSVSFKDLMILWGLVYLGNLFGGYVFSFVLTGIGPNIGILTKAALENIGVGLSGDPWHIIFFSALLAGWLMGLLVWLVTSAQETISRIFLIILVTFTIGFCNLHHCIVGSIEVFSGLLAGDLVELSDYGKFQFWATIGNAIGGTVFVSVLKYSHVRN